MTVKYGKFELPKRIKIDEKTASPTYARLLAEPFERGFGHTVGNSMRRMMLSSLEAPAIISVRIEGVTHEYMAIEGIIEDMVNIILNFKGALFRKLPQSDDPLSHTHRFISNVLEVTREDIDRGGGQYNVTLGDVAKNGIFEVVNPDLHLFTVTKPLKRQIDLRMAMGRGYVPSERHVIRDKSADEILVDSAFSPVRMVNYFVENTRVGQDTDFDRLILEVVTDGRISPVEALSFSSKIALSHFEVFSQLETEDLTFDTGLREVPTDQDEVLEKLCLRIDEIELSVRSTNCLRGANIETIAELVAIPERKMLEFKNFGKKSLTEIKEKLQEMNLSLGMDLTAYGIMHENVRESIRKLQEERKVRKEERKARKEALKESEE